MRLFEEGAMAGIDPGLQQAFLERLGNSSTAGLDLELAIHVAEMVVDCVEAKEKSVGNLFLSETVYKKAENLLLPWRKVIISMRR